MRVFQDQKKVARAAAREAEKKRVAEATAEEERLREEEEKKAAAAASEKMKREREALIKRRELEKKKALEDCREGSIVLQEKFRMEDDDKETKQSKGRTKKRVSTDGSDRKKKDAAAKRTVDDEMWDDDDDQFGVSVASVVFLLPFHTVSSMYIECCFLCRKNSKRMPKSATTQINRARATSLPGLAALPSPTASPTLSSPRASRPKPKNCAPRDPETTSTRRQGRNPNLPRVVPVMHLAVNLPRLKSLSPPRVPSGPRIQSAPNQLRMFALTSPCLVPSSISLAPMSTASRKTSRASPPNRASLLLPRQELRHLPRVVSGGARRLPQRARQAHLQWLGSRTMPVSFEGCWYFNREVTF